MEHNSLSDVLENVPPTIYEEDAEDSMTVYSEEEDDILTHAESSTQPNLPVIRPVIQQPV